MVESHSEFFVTLIFNDLSKLKILYFFSSKSN